MSGVARKVTVNGVSACMRDHAQMRGLNYTTVMGRMTAKWTREQALGIAPAPVRKRGKGVSGVTWSNLQDGPRLDTPFNNLMKAMTGESTAEEYLRLEGVPLNGYVLK